MIPYPLYTRNIIGDESRKYAIKLDSNLVSLLSVISGK
jgi:hypothetical protein